MEEKINVAEILKDKSQGTKLYDLLRNIDVELDKVHTTDVGTYIECTSINEVGSTLLFDYSKLGTEKCWLEGLRILLPSKEMRDWAKFSWKKGDVLVSNDGKCKVIFERFDDDTYTSFVGKYYVECYGKNDELQDYEEEHYGDTVNYTKESEEAAQTYINTIEERLGGKLNMETLEIDKTQPEFKDGDIVALVVRKCTHIAIFQSRQEAYIGFHAVLCQNDEILLEKPFREDVGDIELRLATDSEKQQLFDALAKEGKAWDAEKKQIVDLKPKCEFKPFDRCIWKIRNCEGSIWQASFVSYVDKYGATPMGISIDEDLVNLIILPYNDQTKLLVGTTDEWKGGNHD